MAELQGPSARAVGRVLVAPAVAGAHPLRRRQLTALPPLETNGAGGRAPCKSESLSGEGGGGFSGGELRRRGDVYLEAPLCLQAQLRIGPFQVKLHRHRVVAGEAGGTEALRIEPYGAVDPL